MARGVQAVRRWGTSRAVIISRQIQEQITWPLREVVFVSVEDDAIVLRPVTFPPGAPRSSSAKHSTEAA